MAVNKDIAYGRKEDGLKIEEHAANKFQPAKVSKSLKQILDNYDYQVEKSMKEVLQFISYYGSYSNPSYHPIPGRGYRPSMNVDGANENFTPHTCRLSDTK